MRQYVILGVCALFISCGGSTNERGIASVTTDPTASGSAYNVNDTMPVAAPDRAGDAVTVPATAAPVTAATATVPGKPAPATPQPAASAPQPAAADDNADIKKGQALISKSDCLACHKLQEKLLGPSYKDVANKYPNNSATINQLVDKIKKGGSGVWGAVPMSPHPALADDDAKAMVKYILSLK
ncbi:MAG: c-type cytochrome [Daejeonella sp.]